MASANSMNDENGTKSKRLKKSLKSSLKLITAIPKTNWKRFFIIHGLYLVTATILCVVGSSIFYGFGKIAAPTKYRQCDLLLHRLQSEMTAIISSNLSIDEIDLHLKSSYISIENCMGYQSDQTTPYRFGLNYAYTILSTIGFTNLAHLTAENFFATILYAFFGIYLFSGFLIFLCKWSARYNVIAYEYTYRILTRRPEFVLEVGGIQTWPVFIFSMATYFIYSFIVAGIFVAITDWTFWPSLFFIFQSNMLMGQGFVSSTDPAFLTIYFLLNAFGIVLGSNWFGIMIVWWTKIIESLADFIINKFNIVSAKSPPSRSDMTIRETLSKKSIKAKSTASKSPLPPK